jgi:hypothetical protein
MSWMTVYNWPVFRCPQLAGFGCPPRKRSASEEHKYADAKAALEELGPMSLTVLRHLERHGKLKFRGNSCPPLPDGISGLSMRVFLNHCATKDLVTIDRVMTNIGALYPAVDETYEIAPGMKNVLMELLYPPSQSAN